MSYHTYPFQFVCVFASQDKNRQEISRMKSQDELPNVPSNNEIEQLEKQIEELEKKKSEMLEEQDPTELMFGD